MSKSRPVLIALLTWAALGSALAIPVVVAAMSPLLAWREPIYIIAGFAGVVAMTFLLLQPLLARGYLPGLRLRRSRWVHAVLGGLLVIAVIVHVAGLWLTSPPDVVDVLLLRSPTPFSIWGVAAMWAVFAAALLAASRRRLHMPPRIWRRVHTGLAGVIVGGSVVHAMLIEGTMGSMSKAVLCALALAATAKVIGDVWMPASSARRGG